MKFIYVAVAGALLGIGVRVQQETLPDALLKELKAATVLIREARPDGAYVTTALLARKEGVSAFLVSASPPNVTLTGVDFEAVFHSGNAKQELMVPAKLVTQSIGLINNIMVFKVPSKSLPKPVDVAKPAAIRETMPVFKVGFPASLGRHTRDRRPALSVTTGAVSGLRKDDHGRLLAVQVDIGGLQETSGSPVFDAKGGFVGVVLGSFEMTRIRLLCPPGAFDAVFRGRVDDVQLSERANSEGRITFDVVAETGDPLGALKSVTLLLAPLAKVVGTPRPDDSGTWAQVTPDMSRHDLKRGEGSWKGEVILTGDIKVDVDYTAQVHWTRTDGSQAWSAPRSFYAEFQLGDPARRRARSEWLGSEAPKEAGAGTETRKSGDLPKPVLSGETLRGSTTKEPGLAVTTILHHPVWLARQSLFSSDGNWLYLLDEVGVLRKISVPGLVEERKLILGHPCRWIERSRLGLVLYIPETQDAWLIDEATLEIKKRMGVGVVSYVASSPLSTLAYGYGPKADLAVIDLAAGSVVNRIAARSFTNETSPRTQRHARATFLGEWTTLRVSADGKFVFVDAGGLHRFRVDGVNLVCEEIGPPISGLRLGNIHGWPPGMIVMSPDSKTIALPGDSNREKLDGLPPIPKGYGTYLFNSNDLRKARGMAPTRIVSLSAGDGPTLGIDIRTNKVQVLDASGALVRELSFFAPQDHRYFHTSRHPSGRLMVAMLADRLLWLEFEK